MNELIKIDEKPETSLSVFANSTEFENCFKIAHSLSKSELVPKTYQNKPENCLIALDVARQVKNSPLIVMQNLHIILGKPSWSSTYISGVIHSKYSNVQIKSGGTGDEKFSQVIAIDKNGNTLEGAKVTVGMAKKEGWYSKQGSKWVTMEDLMLQYRALAFFGRVFCPDALIGLQSEYEIMDVNQVKQNQTSNLEERLTSKTKNIGETIINIEPEIIKEELQLEEPLEVICELICSKCGDPIEQRVYDFSVKKYGVPYCRKHQP